MEINKNLRVSTMTMCSGINANIDLSKLYDNLPINEEFRYIEFFDKNKGESYKKVKKPRKKTEKKYFYNQLTIQIFEDNKIINTKLFNNGKIQMTGLKHQTQAKNCVTKIINSINLMVQKEQIVDNNNLEPLEFKICMINTDFDIRFEIKRDILHRIVINEGYYSSFEPTIYPGVNIKYYYNHNSLNNDGICKCEGSCDGKGNGMCCKKITVAAFNSGCIIITGAQSFDQLNKAYDFITKIIDNNKDKICVDNSNLKKIKN